MMKHLIFNIIAILVCVLPTASDAASLYQTSQKILGSTASGEIYLTGDRYTDGSYRFAIDADTGNVEVQQTIDGIAQPASFGTGPNSLWVGLVGVASIGDQLVSESPSGEVHFLIHTEFDGELSTKDARVLHAYQYTERSIVVPDDSGEWTGTEYSYNYPSADHRIIKRAYYKTGAIAATEPVKLYVWEGTDDTGPLRFRATYPASKFIDDSEIVVEAIGFVEFEEGVNYFVKIFSDADFSLKTTSDFAYPWTAGDVSLVREEKLLQTKPWVSGDTWKVGDYYIQDRKIYICNQTGTQTGSFETNLDKWHVLDASDAGSETDPIFTAWDKSSGISITESQISDLQSYLTSETDPIFSAWNKSTGISITESQISDNYWDRTGAVLNPANAGDDLGLNGGSIVSPNGTKTMTLNDSGFTLHDGTRNRIFINFGGRSDIFSQDGNTYLLIGDGSIGMLVDGTYRFGAWPAETFLKSEDGTKKVKLTNTAMTFNDATRDRLYIDGTNTKTYSPDGTTNMNMGNSAAQLYISNELRLSSDASRTQLLHSANYIDIDATDIDIVAPIIKATGDFFVHDGTKDRLKIDSSYSELFSPNGTSDIAVQNENVSATVAGTRRLHIPLNNNTILSGQDGYTELHVGTAALSFWDATRTRLDIDDVLTQLHSPDGTNYIDIMNGGIYLSRWISPDTNKELTIENTGLNYNDGARDRILANSTDTELYAPDGTAGLEIDNTYVHIHQNDGTRVLIQDTYTELYAPNPTTFLTLSNNALTFYDGSRNRLVVNGSMTKMYSESGAGNISVSGSGAFFNDGTLNRVVVDDTETALFAPNGTNHIYVENSGIQLDDGSWDRIHFDATNSTLTSPNGANNLKVSNAGIDLDGDVTFNGAIDFNDGARDRIIIDATSTKLVGPSGNYYLEVNNTGTWANGSRIITKMDTVISGNVAAKLNSFNTVDTRYFTYTVTSPNSPMSGDIFWITDIYGNASGHNITIDFQHRYRQMDDQEIVVNTDFKYMKFVFTGGPTGWMKIGEGN